MCGIAGFYHSEHCHEKGSDLLKKMIGIMYHRGPDEAGIYLDDHIGLGHARLSIIDLAGGSQPIHNEDKSLWIIYNGEVFNYVELKKELIKKGHTFYTTTDTEVILHLFEEKREECLNELNGQFAFAIWDSYNKELFLARDRVGIRPLHYTNINGSFYFSSEIKSLFQVEEIQREIDPVGMDQTFTFWTTLPGRTIFKNISELKPGHFIKIKNDTVTEKQYWSVPYNPPEELLTSPPSDISEQIMALLTDAVRIRLRADVPVGSYLSGGLDSSGVTALISKHFNANVQTFGIRFEEGAFDEGEHQKSMVDFLKVRHHELTANNSMIADNFPKIIWHGERPLLRTAPVPLYLLSRKVREKGIVVVLTGEGADEVFGGYNIFREALVRKFISRQPTSRFRKSLIDQLYPHIFKNPLLKNSLYSFFMQGLDDADNPLFSHLIRWNNTSRIKTFFADSLSSELQGYNAYKELTDTLPEDFNNRNTLAKAQFLEKYIFLSNYLLSSQGDRVAMAHSIEIRVPFLDYRIIDLMAKVSPTWKILGLNEKFILKKALRNVLPKNICERSKHPFRAPIQQSFFRANTPESIQELLTERSIKKTGLFNPQKVSLLVKKIKNNTNISEVDGMALAGILSTLIVCNQFVEGVPKTEEKNISYTVFVDKRKNN